MRRLVVLIVVIVMILTPFWNYPVFGGYVWSNSLGGFSSSRVVVPDSNVWTKNQTEIFVNKVVYPIFRDPGYYPGSDVMMGTFAILMGCTGNCVEWIAHVVEVDNITPNYMCTWVYEYGVNQDYGRHRFEKREVVEVMSRAVYLRYLEDFLGTEMKPNCPQFMVD